MRETSNSTQLHPRPDVREHIDEPGPRPARQDENATADFFAPS